ncbi:MAG: hypothetical protein WA210_16535, partial [Burkholderiaceae bacterium]
MADPEQRPLGRTQILEMIAGANPEKMRTYLEGQKVPGHVISGFLENPGKFSKALEGFVPFSAIMRHQSEPGSNARTGEAVGGTRRAGEYSRQFGPTGEGFGTMTVDPQEFEVGMRGGIDDALESLGGTPKAKPAADDADIAAALGALDAEQGAAKEDTSVLRKVAITAGGIWKFIAQAAGLPGDALVGLAEASDRKTERNVRAWTMGRMGAQGEIAPAIKAIAPTSSYIRDFVPNTVNAAAADLGSDYRMEPLRPQNRDEQTLETIGENIGAATTFGLGIAARGANLTSRGIDAATRTAVVNNVPRSSVVSGTAPGVSMTPIDRLFTESATRLGTTAASAAGLATAEGAIGAAAGVGQDVL